MPYIVAVTRAPSEDLAGGYRSASVHGVDPERWLPELAALLGLTVFDARRRLSGESPWLVASLQSADSAEQLVGALRARGFAALSCDAEAARPWSPPANVRLVFEPATLVLEPMDLRVPLAELRLIVVAAFDSEREHEQVTHVKTHRDGGTAPVSHFSYDRTHERLLYLFAAPGAPPLRIAEHALRCPELPVLDRHERFDRAVQLLRERAPQAAFDDRFASAPRRRGSYSPSIHDADRRSVDSDNVEQTDLAVWLQACEAGLAP